MLGKEASIHLMISLIFNQSTKSGQAFQVPQKLLERLGKSSFDLIRLESDGYAKLYEAISTKPCLHRFPATMAKNLYASILFINTNHFSDPRNIWKDKRDEEIIEGLMRLPGIGHHKAVQCLLYLHFLGEIASVSQKYVAYMQSACGEFFNNMNADMESIASIGGILPDVE